jgi:hypothetical protein
MDLAKLVYDMAVVLNKQAKEKEKEEKDGRTD